MPVSPVRSRPCPFARNPNKPHHCPTVEPPLLMAVDGGQWRSISWKLTQNRPLQETENPLTSQPNTRISPRNLPPVVSWCILRQWFRQWRFEMSGRYSVQTSRGHRCVWNSWGDFTISWTFDRYYADSRLRFPHTYRRDTDEAGAKRFCKRWGIPFPEKAGVK